MVPSVFTVSGWHCAQVDAVTGEGNAKCPVGGIPWHEVQVSAAVLFHTGAAFAPETTPKAKLPWQ
jgi:hypothetical protein